MDEIEENHPQATDEAFASAVRATREAASMSQADVAERMAERGFDFHQQTIYKIESGRRRVSVGEASALAVILNVSLDFLIGDQQKMSSLIAAYGMQRRERDELTRQAGIYARTMLLMARVADGAETLREVDDEWLDGEMAKQTPVQVMRDVRWIVEAEIERRGEATGPFVQALVAAVMRDDQAIRSVDHG